MKCPRSVFLLPLLFLIPSAACFAQQGQQSQLENCITRDQLGNILDKPICTPVQPQAQLPPQLPQRQPRMKYGNGGEVGTPRVFGVVGYTFESSSKLTASVSDFGSVSTPTRGFNGGFIQPTFNVIDFFSLIGHFDAAYHQENIAGVFNPITGLTTSLPLQLTTLSYTAGPQVYLMRHSYAWQPFAHVTLGAATLLMNSATQNYLGANTSHETAFAYQVGGGLDYRSSSSRLGWRVGQIDYIHAKKTISGVDFTYTAVKLGVGVSF